MGVARTVSPRGSNRANHTHTQGCLLKSLSETQFDKSLKTWYFRQLVFCNHGCLIYCYLTMLTGQNEGKAATEPVSVYKWRWPGAVWRGQLHQPQGEDDQTEQSPVLLSTARAQCWEGCGGEGGLYRGLGGCSTIVSVVRLGIQEDFQNTADRFNAIDACALCVRSICLWCNGDHTQFEPTWPAFLCIWHNR